MNRFDELPENIRKKISCVDARAPISELGVGTVSAPISELGVGVEPISDMGAGAEHTLDPNDRDVCWCWTGTFQVPRLRRKNYAPESDRDTFRHTSGCNVRERGTPMIWSSTVGYAVAAHRELYALWSGTPIRAVPRLQRCHDDRCVRPSHAQELDPVPERARGRTRAGLPLGDALEEPEEPAGDAWAVLIREQPLPEIGLKISKALWKRYEAWCAAQPDDDDED